ncbi:MAG: hypothetical protein ACOCY8_00185 [Spirochaetota bacterium]
MTTKPIAKSLPVASILLVLALVVGCESVFTTSPLSFLQRDPSQLSAGQRVTYGHDALASGDTDKMADAFDALKDSDDPETQLLAAELAVASTGLEGKPTEVAAELANGGDPETVVQEALDGFSEDDYERLVAAAELIDDADDTVQPSSEQYAVAAVGLIAVAVEENGGAEGLESLSPGDPGYEVVEQARAFLIAAEESLQADGESTELLDQIGGAIGW